jgi:2-hydroxy-3-oxopropionate reductase
VRKLAAAAGPAGIRLVDAPLSRGGQREDEEGEAEIVVWVGAAADHFDLARPIFDLLGDRVVYCGGVGLGQTTKIVNNLIAHALLALVGEALALGVRAGASLDVLATSLQHGTGQNRILDELFPHSLFQGEFRPGLRLDHALKDIDLARELAAEHELELTSCAPVRELFEKALARGWGELSAHSAVRLIEERFGVRLRSLLAPVGDEESGR